MRIININNRPYKFILTIIIFNINDVQILKGVVCALWPVRRGIMGSADDSIDILYVEDDEVDIQDVRREFQKVNELIRFAIAHDGVQALNKLHGHNGEEKLYPAPKVILLDINMPKMNGMEFLTALRKDPELRTINVFIVTASYDTQAKLAMRDLNIAGCIVKPLEYADALNVFWNILHDR